LSELIDNSIEKIVDQAVNSQGVNSKSSKNQELLEV